MKILAYRNGPEGTSGLRPFLILGGDQISGYEQAFEFLEPRDFSLRVFQTISGNGVMWSSFTFRFDDKRVLINEINSGGRNCKTQTLTFTRTGKIKEVKEVEDN